jgi:hypothetical protein
MHGLLYGVHLQLLATAVDILAAVVVVVDAAVAVDAALLQVNHLPGARALMQHHMPAGVALAAVAVAAAAAAAAAVASAGPCERHSFVRRLKSATMT